VKVAVTAPEICDLQLPSPSGFIRLLVVDPDRATREAVAAWTSDHPWIDVDVFASAESPPAWQAAGERFAASLQGAAR